MVIKQNNETHLALLLRVISLTLLPEPNKIELKPKDVNFSTALIVPYPPEHDQS